MVAHHHCVFATLNNLWNLHICHFSYTSCWKLYFNPLCAEFHAKRFNAAMSGTKRVNHDHKLSRRGRLSPSSTIKIALETSGLDIWDNNNAENLCDSFVLRTMHQSELDQFHDSMRTEMQDMSRLHIYNNIKVQFKLEKYVTFITSLIEN